MGKLSSHQASNASKEKDSTDKRGAYSILSPTQKSRKIITFQEVIQTGSFSSKREVSKLLYIPNSTMQIWVKQKNALQNSKDIVGIFFATPEGSDLLKRIILASMYNNKCGASGILGVQEFLRHTGLNGYVASSDGALQAFWMRCEGSILAFGKQWEETLSTKIEGKKIAIASDELFRQGKPCLVAIATVANYILLEKFTEDRKATTWKAELEKAIKSIGVTIEQNTSDLCGALRSTTKSMGAVHSPDLFHGQYEIAKATSAALSSQERAAEIAIEEIEAKIQKESSRPIPLKKEEKEEHMEKQKELIKQKNALQVLRDEKKSRREKVQKAKKSLGRIYHPINFDTGKIQSTTAISKKIDEQFEVISKAADEAKLGQSSKDRIEKSKRAFDFMKDYFRQYCILFLTVLAELHLNSSQRKFFKEVVFPLAYLQIIWKRLPKEEKERCSSLLSQLQTQFYTEGPWTVEFKEALMRRGKELAEQFQRSSSCVEGRNGVLSLLMHKFHRINESTLRVLTIVHNFGVRREDGSTAAMRFFDGVHDDLFEHLVKNVSIPGKPRSQSVIGKQKAA